MADDKEKKPEPLVPVHDCDTHGSLAILSDGTRSSLVPFKKAQPGEDLRGKHAFLRRDDGVYERFHAPGSGPAQVATPAYRDHWEETFGSRGGVS